MKTVTGRERARLRLKKVSSQNRPGALPVPGGQGVGREPSLTCRGCAVLFCETDGSVGGRDGVVKPHSLRVYLVPQESVRLRFEKAFAGERMKTRCRRRCPRGGRCSETPVLFCPLGGFSREELLKIWKGLFYCMRVQDEPLLQVTPAAPRPPRTGTARSLRPGSI